MTITKNLVGYLLPTLLCGVSSAQAADRPGPQPMQLPGWGGSPSHGYHGTATTGAFPGYDRYGARYLDSAPVTAAPRGSAPWHRLVEPRRPSVPDWSSRQGSGYQGVPSSAVVHRSYRSTPAGYAPMPRQTVSGYPPNPGGVRDYRAWRRAPADVSAGLAPNALAGTEQAERAALPAEAAGAQILDYSDYTSIPEKPPSGMPKPGIDFGMPPDE